MTNISSDAIYRTYGTSSISAPDKLKLNKMNFSLGIRANEINENFDLIKYWIEAERLRIGGWGIVEGFDLTKDLPRYAVDIGPGVIINEHGEEVHVNAHKIVPSEECPVGLPKPTWVEETLTTSSDGILQLSSAMYSIAYKHTIIYRLPNNIRECDSREFSFVVEETGQKLIVGNDISDIYDNLVHIPGHRGERIVAGYWSANDHIDGIFIKKDGSEYQYEMGIESTSPSQEKIQDYFKNGYYLIGFAYWHVGSTIDVDFITGDRTLRSIYVDRNNILYLNGKIYKEKTVVYFEEPNPPQPNDLWYNLEDEILYIWRPNENDVWEWRPVNDLNRLVTVAYQFKDTQNPTDLQTFLFYGHPELNFIPNEHQLQIIIDQIVLMEDQYEELYTDGEDGLPSGYGFKLKRPLERPSIVEVRISRNVNTNNKRNDLFAHMSFFGNNGCHIVTDTSQRIYPVQCDFECYRGQIEIYKNGIRLIEGQHYFPVLSGTSANADTAEEGELCDRISLNDLPQLDDVIEYRVLRPMATYQNFKAQIKIWEDKVAELERQNTALEDRLNTLSQNFADLRDNHTEAIAQMQVNIQQLQSDKLNDRPGIVSNAYLDPSIAKGIVSGKIENMQLSVVEQQLYLEGLSPSDYIVVSYVLNHNADPILLEEGHDYSLDVIDDGLYITLEAKWLNYSTAELYITGLKIGV